MTAKVKYPKLNKRLLNKVLAHIKAEPRRFNMGTYGETVDTDVAPCGTQACIGGWAYLLTLPPKRWKKVVFNAELGNLDIEDAAQKALGLTRAEARSLFLTHTWEQGEKGIATAEAKIKLLKEDRERFVEVYQHNHGIDETDDVPF